MANYYIYIPGEGHWPIPNNPQNKKEARKKYLEWAQRKRMPPNSRIDLIGID